jgi:hypothetical protein
LLLLLGHCAVTILRPRRRQHPFYRPINKPSDDPNIPSIWDISATPRCNRSPTKKSGLQSPKKRTASEAFESSPLSVDVSVDETRRQAFESFLKNRDIQKEMATFRTRVDGQSDKCAISGLGKGWGVAMGVGPGIDACHIVPPYAWDLYPLGDDDEDDCSIRHLELKWENTWASDNGLWMQSSIHGAHDSRILAIHPETFKIRSFAPYDLIEPYHNKIAEILRNFLPVGTL